MLTKLDAFRIALSDFQVSTYTYDPLGGIRSITPLSGLREIYKYDQVKRLQTVTDMQSNILKEYKYNYKP